jgi:hypothetical protein
MNVVRRIPITLGSLLMTVYAMTCTAAPDVKPGLWETTVKMEMPGMPMAIPPTVHRHCVTEQDLVPKPERPGEECRIVDQAVSGNTVTWRVGCDTQDMKADGTGEIIYSGDTYRGRIVMHMQQAGMGAMTMNQSLEGRWVGPCPK